MAKKAISEPQSTELQTLNSLTPMLFGASDATGLVAAELLQKKEGRDEVLLYSREGDEVTSRKEAFCPFLLIDADRLEGRGADFDDLRLEVGDYERDELEGAGPISTRLTFKTWKTCSKARSWLAKRTGYNSSAPEAPFIYVNDPIRQHFSATGLTMFKGMEFEDVRRMQVDIECITTEGYEFCNAEREGDRIVAIAMLDSTGWCEVLTDEGSDEKTMLTRFVELVAERDPDVLEGHNIFNFDLPYIAKRAKRLKVKLGLGRDGSIPSKRPSRMAMGERQVAYERFEIHGRHVVDTLFLVQAYDLSSRALGSFGLKDVARHFGLASESRTYIEGSEISKTYASDPKKLLEYVKDDVVETKGISDILSRSYFVQAQILPYSYQNVCVRGNATKIDALMIREYLRQGRSLPIPGMARRFAGGYTDMFYQGVARNVHHCDVRSLYPSLMLTRDIGPESDELGVFLGMLESLRDYRLDAKQKMLDSKDEADRNHYNALQGTFKILINSFYGYLGFMQGQFSDFDAAERITADGRELLGEMIDTLRRMGADPIEIDTDGIYFMPGDMETGKFRQQFAESLPEGIGIEFDGEFEAMYSYKMKNYALLSADGSVIIKGAALKSRGLEPFQREFLKKLVRLRLEGREKEIPKMKDELRTSIEGRALDIRELAKTVTLQDAPSTYAAKIAKKSRSRDAGYELALKSSREYRAGDQLTFYITGEKKTVAAYEYAREVSEWDPKNRDENVLYYLAKLDALYKKFYDESAGESQQGLLAL